MMNIWQPTAKLVGEFDPDILPVYAFYDWVKYYAYVPGSGNAGSDNNFIELWTIILTIMIIQDGQRLRILGMEITVISFTIMLFLNMVI